MVEPAEASVLLRYPGGRGEVDKERANGPKLRTSFWLQLDWLVVFRGLRTAHLLLYAVQRGQ